MTAIRAETDSSFGVVLFGSMNEPERPLLRQIVVLVSIQPMFNSVRFGKVMDEIEVVTHEGFSVT